MKNSSHEILQKLVNEYYPEKGPNRDERLKLQDKIYEKY